MMIAKRLLQCMAVLMAVMPVNACKKSEGAAAVPSMAATSATVPAQENSFYAAVASMKAPVPKMVMLGKTMFADPSLSVSGKQSCASCHSPQHAYGPANDLPVQLSGPDLKQSGTRAAPSLRYTYNIPVFSASYYDPDDENGGADQGPTGGHTWDGRVQSLHEQVLMPLTSPYEMANANTDAIIKRVEAASYAKEFRDTFGADIFNDPKRSLIAVQMSFEAFLETPEEFYPYSSKFDAWMRGKAKPTAAEKRGLDLFNDPNKGNCAQCHISKIGVGGALPLFSDWGHIALGVPRNSKLPANKDSSYHDLGLCGPVRTDLKDKPEFCGLFRTPSLRNVATRKAFFHNGVVHTLRDAVRFYAQRDTHPEKWYPRGADGKVQKFNDLPEQYWKNVNMEAPFGRKAGEPDVLTESEIGDIVAFLGTLTDGYKVKDTIK